MRKALILKHARVSVVDLLVSPKNFLCWPLLASTIVLECIFTRQLHSFAMNNRLATSRSTFLTDVRPGKKQSMVENPNSPGRARRRAGPTDTGTLSTRKNYKQQRLRNADLLVVVVRRVLRPVDRRQVDALLDELPERRHLAEPRDVDP